MRVGLAIALSALFRELCNVLIANTDSISERFEDYGCACAALSRRGLSLNHRFPQSEVRATWPSRAADSDRQQRKPHYRVRRFFRYPLSTHRIRTAPRDPRRKACRTRTLT